MRKMIFSAVLVVLAGACWVLAQNSSSSNLASPYGATTVTAPTATPPATKPAPPAPLPDLPPVDPVIVAPTRLDSPVQSADPSLKIPDVTIPIVPTPPQAPLVSAQPIQVPPVPLAPASPIAAMPDLIIPPAPPINVAPIIAPPAPALPAAPINMAPIVAPPAPVLPPLVIPSTPNVPAAPINMAPTVTNPDIPPAPITTPPLPTPSIPPIEEKPHARAAVAAPLSSIPALPPVPGVNSDRSSQPFGSAPAVVAGPVANLPSYQQPAQAPGPIAQSPPNFQQPAQIPVPAGQPAPNFQQQIPVPGVTAQTPPATVHTVDDSAGVFGNGIEGPTRLVGPTIWGGAEYLMWFVKPTHSPPLVQAISGAQPGETNFQGSQITQLFPTSGDKFDPLNGIRATIGFWLDSMQTFGFEANYLTFGRSTINELFTSNPNFILARPFLNGDTGAPSLIPISTLDGTNGAVKIYSTFHMEGGEANLLMNSIRSGPQFNLLLGVRYFELNEKLEVAQQSTDATTNYSSQSFDEFSTQNRFLGGQIGLRWSYDGPQLFASVTGKIAFGAMEENVRINGSTQITADGATSFANGGMLALPTNIGSYSRTQTAYIPELTATIGYRFTSWASAYIGYNFLYVNNLVRPGNQIDTTINPANFPFGSGSPTALRPQFQFRDESLWMQGVNVGVTLSY